MISTRERVPKHTAEEINARILREIDQRVSYYEANPELIPDRLQELDAEWDIERAIEANAAAVGFTGTVLGATLDRRWFVVPMAVAAFLFQHAVQGWCPPVPALRRLGFRTSYEIDQERQALKALRGDYEGVSAASDRVRSVLSAVRRN
jgi:hypothetical protein